MRALLMSVAVLALAAGGIGVATAEKVIASPHNAKQTQKAVAAAIANPKRADQAGDDARRKAAEVLVFSGVGPGDEVLDLLPGTGYWTRLFSGIVGPSGHVYSIWPAAANKYAAETQPKLDAMMMPNVTTKLLGNNVVTASEPVDLFWTVQNYHDVANAGGEAALDAFNAQVFRALKAGGTYVVIDHADAAGSGLTGTQTKHRIDPAVVKAEVMKAGFTFVGESDVLRNPSDDHSLAVFDPTVKGHTDQFVYKFRKPR